jgi:putative ABC transport system permease protein
MWLWMRWTRRDLAHRWALVVAIALTVALGTGMFAALGSTAAWRRQSNDASFALLGVHDLRVRLSEGSVARAGTLRAAVARIPHAGWIRAAEERLVFPVQVDASGGGRVVLAPGEVVGVQVSGGGPHLDRVHLVAGRALRPGDADRPTALLDRAFAREHGLPATGTLRVSGGVAVRWVGHGMSPEYLTGSGQQGAYFGAGGYAVLYAPLEQAQRLARLPGGVNDLVVGLTPGADRRVVQGELERALAILPGVGATVSTRDELDSYRVLYEDIDNDQQLWNVIALLVLSAAAFAALNLVSRIVEAGRREIGIGMALGVRPRLLALRPLLVGAQVAALGVVAGLAVGLLLTRPLLGIYQSVLPMPVWRAPFQPRMYLLAGVIGLALPVLATVPPVLRAVRVEPVAAIRTGHLAASGGLAPLARRLPRTGSSVAQIPLRNLLRTPRRTLLTAFGIGAAITAMVGVIGMLDSFRTTIERTDQELTRAVPDRVTIQLDRFHALESHELAAVTGSEVLADARPGLQLAAGVSARGTSVDTIVELLDLEAGLWTPTITAGARSGGIVLSEKAASDLGVRPGDTVELRHPRLEGPLAVRMVTSRVRVAGLHPNPMRFPAYMDQREAARFGLTGLANIVQARPAAGAGEAEVRRGLFELSSVRSVQPVTAVTRSFSDTLDQFTDILRIAELVVLLLALLIAFNSTSISADERRREHATMFAFGLPVHKVLAMATVEALLTALAGTATGIAAGYVVLRWITGSLLPRTLPDIGVRPDLAGGTVLTALAIGTVAVLAAVLLTAPKLRRMDVPATLRVVE